VLDGMVDIASIAIRHAQARTPEVRVGTVDCDAHHGNRTRAIFYGYPSVLSLSLHQDDLFPRDSGAISERGEGAGDGTRSTCRCLQGQAGAAN
jgi:acetoin utilization deacetylase AcuC-like enzyme